MSFKRRVGRYGWTLVTPAKLPQTSTLSFALKWGLGYYNVGMKASNRQNVNRSTQFESGGMRDFGLNTTQEEWRGKVKF